MDRLHAVLAAVAFLAAIPAFGLQAPHRRTPSRQQLEVPRMQVARLAPPRSHALATPPPARPQAPRNAVQSEPGSGIRRWFSHVNWYQANTPPDPAAIPARR